MPPQTQGFKHVESLMMPWDSPNPRPNSSKRDELSFGIVGERPYSCAIPTWCVYESAGFHLGNTGVETEQNP